MPYTGGRLDLLFEAALGADPDGDQADWDWVDITSLVHQPDTGPAVIIKPGRPSATASAKETSIDLTLLNRNGEWTSPTQTYSEFLVPGLPIRVTLQQDGDNHRATAFLSSAKPRWDKRLNSAMVDVTCRGALWRVTRDGQPLHSAAYRAVQNINPTSITTGFSPIAHWPLEQDSTPLTFPNAVPGGEAMQYVGEVSVGGDTSFTGSDGALRLSQETGWSGVIPTYTATGQWTVLWGYNIPTEPAEETILMVVETPPLVWEVSLVPGVTAIRLRAITNGGGSVLLNSTFAITEATFYGQPVAYSLTTTDNGADIDYVLWVRPETGGAGLNNTLATAPHGNVIEVAGYGRTGLDGAGLCHVAVYNDAGIDPDNIASEFADALIGGRAGEKPWARFQRLCIEEHVGYNMEQALENDELMMGPQGVSTLADLLAECEAVEGVVMHDAGTFGSETGLVYFPARETRYNRDADLTLTMSPGAGQVPDFQPLLDDQELVTSTEVSRRGGGKAIAVADDAVIDRQGNRSRSFTVNTSDDQFLADIAGMRLAMGSNLGFRFPTVSIDFRNPHAQTLAADWLACGIGSKVVVTDPPRQYPPDDIETFIEGYTEELGMYHWVVKLNLSPAAMWTVNLLADTSGDTHDYLGHLEADSVVLAEDLDTTETAVDVTADPLITTTADDFPVRVMVGGEEMRVDNCVGASNPQTLTVVRSVNGVVKTHSTGAAVTLAEPLVLVL